MRRILLLLAEFVALSVPLTWLWMEWGLDVYVHFLFGLLAPIYEAVGATHVEHSAAGHRYLSYVPFLVLMCITPGVTWRRRLWGSLGGCALILLAHLILTVAVDDAHAQHGEGGAATSALFPFLLVADGLPFGIWYLVFRDFLHSLVAKPT